MAAKRGWLLVLVGIGLVGGSVFTLLSDPNQMVTFLAIATAVSGVFGLGFGSRELLSDADGDSGADPEEALHKTDRRIGRQGST